MGLSITKWALLLISIFQVQCVRISPKLDFGSDSNGSENQKFPPKFQSRSVGYGDREFNKLQVVNTPCVTGNCNITEKQNGVVTDVVVHVKTKIDDDVKNNSPEVTPDIPIIVGTKTIELPQLPANPYSGIPSPFPIKSLLQTQVQHTEPRVNNGYEYNYASGHQGNGGEVHLPYNEQNQNGNNLPLPQFTWNNLKLAGVNANSGYNPLEFNKIYLDSRSNFPIRWMENKVSNARRNIPSNWGPCFCQNPQEHYLSNSYTSY